MRAPASWSACSPLPLSPALVDPNNAINHHQASTCLGLIKHQETPKPNGAGDDAHGLNLSIVS